MAVRPAVGLELFTEIAAGTFPLRVPEVRGIVLGKSTDCYPGADELHGQEVLESLPVYP